MGNEDQGMIWNISCTAMAPMVIKTSNTIKLLIENLSHMRKHT